MLIFYVKCMEIHTLSKYSSRRCSYIIILFEIVTKVKQYLRSGLGPGEGELDVSDTITERGNIDPDVHKIGFWSP